MRVLWLTVGMLALLGCGLTRAPMPTPEGQELLLAKQTTEIPSVLLVPTVPATTTTASEAEPDTLTLAAECLERGDRASAAVHLEAYVCRHPDQVMFRFQLAEMLVRLDHDSTARAHLERFIADASFTTGPARKQLVSAHTRLMEIAQRADDRFGELFHRGAGLFLLAKEQEKLADGDPAFGEEMLCKAMKALVEAKELNPTDAQTRLCLAEVYQHMGNVRAADAERAGARGALVPGQLTARDRRNCLIMSQIVR